MRRPVRINFLWHAVGNRKVLIPAADGELEELPPGLPYHAELYWLLPDGGADSRGLTRGELEDCLRLRQLEFTDVPEQGRRAIVTPQRQR